MIRSLSFHQTLVVPGGSAPLLHTFSWAISGPVGFKCHLGQRGSGQVESLPPSLRDWAAVVMDGRRGGDRNGGSSKVCILWLSPPTPGPTHRTAPSVLLTPRKQGRFSDGIRKHLEAPARCGACWGQLPLWPLSVLSLFRSKHPCVCPGEPALSYVRPMGV